MMMMMMMMIIMKDDEKEKVNECSGQLYAEACLKGIT